MDILALQMQHQRDENNILVTSTSTFTLYNEGVQKSHLFGVSFHGEFSGIISTLKRLHEECMHAEGLRFIQCYEEWSTLDDGICLMIVMCFLESKKSQQVKDWWGKKGVVNINEDGC